MNAIPIRKLYMLLLLCSNEAATVTMATQAIRGSSSSILRLGTSSAGMKTTRAMRDETDESTLLLPLPLPPSKPTRTKSTRNLQQISTEEILTTLFDISAKAQSGAMFDLTAKPESSVTIVQFDIHTASLVEEDYQVWTKDGSHQGYESSQIDWYMAGCAPMNGKGLNKQTPLPPENMDWIRIMGGQTKGIYITLVYPGSYMQYNGPSQFNPLLNGRQVLSGAVFDATDHLEIITGVGKTYLFGAGTFYDRIINGNVHYMVGLPVRDTPNNEGANNCRPSMAPSLAPTDTPSLSQKPSFAPTQIPSVYPSDIPSATPSFQPSDLPSKFPSVFPSIIPSEDPSALPSGSPSVSPSDLPSSSPTIAGSRGPTMHPTKGPTSIPSFHPSSLPSTLPSAIPSKQPSTLPSVFPSTSPSVLPSDVPSVQPSFIPSYVPSDGPSPQPSRKPSIWYSIQPTHSPTSEPSFEPSVIPTVQPTVTPTTTPSLLPTAAPTSSPSVKPSARPSTMPSTSPSDDPTAEASASGLYNIAVVAAAAGEFELCYIYIYIYIYYSRTFEFDQGERGPLLGFVISIRHHPAKIVQFLKLRSK